MSQLTFSKPMYQGFLWVIILMQPTVLCAGLLSLPSDSLINQLEHVELNSQAYAVTLNALAKELTESDPDSALMVSKQVQELIQENNYYELIGQSFIVISTAFSYKAQYDSSTAYGFKALDWATANKDTLTIIDANNNLGIDFLYQDEYVTSLQYFERVLDLSVQCEDTLRWAHALNNIGMIHGLEGRMEHEIGYYKEAGELFSLIKEKEGYGNVLLNIGTIHTASKKYQLAYQYYTQALSIFTELSYTSAIAQTHMNLAENYFCAGNLEKAEQESFKTLEYVDEYNFDQDRIYTYDLLTKIYKQKGNYKGALAYQGKMYELKEQVFNAEKSMQVGELQTKYETEVKQAEIERLTLRNRLTDAELAETKWQMAFVLAGVFSLIGVIAFLFWWKTKMNKAEKEEQTLRFEALQKRYIELLNGPTKIELDIDLATFNDRLVNPLTKREYDVLKNSMSGKTNQEIADELFVSLSTVKFHMGNIYNKLGVNNKKEALEYVVKSS